MDKRLFDYLSVFRNRISFHTPGHKGGEGAPRRLRALFGNFLAYDQTEVFHLDQLSHPQGILKTAMEDAAKVFLSGRTWFLVEGASLGNKAMLLALGEKKSVLVERASHRSLMAGMILADHSLLTLYNSFDEGSQVTLPATKEEVKRRIEEAKKEDIAPHAMVITSPTYDGLIADLEGILEVAEEEGVLLLIDEAHGSHLPFTPLRQYSAFHYGTAWVSSIHKTTGSLTQTALLHVKEEGAFSQKLNTAVSLLQTTSPSYLLMASIVENTAQLQEEGHIIHKKAHDLAQRFTEKLKNLPGITVFDEAYFMAQGIKKDPTKVLISGLSLGYTGLELQKILQNYEIDVEKADFSKIVLLISPGTLEKHTEKVYNRLKELSPKKSRSIPPHPLPKTPLRVLSLRDAFFSDRITLPTAEAAGRIAATTVAPEPPGVPLLAPGEIISLEMVTYLLALQVEEVEVVTE